MSQKHRILVIKHGALGDFILASGPMVAISCHHPDSHITLLTTKPYALLAEEMGIFDEIWVDNRPKIWHLKAFLGVVGKLRDGQFDRVYDLQTSGRSSLYFRLIGRKKPEWNGVIEWCSHPHSNPRRIYMHTTDRQSEQLSVAGIQSIPKPTVKWLKGNVSKFSLPEHYALVVAGGSMHRPEKRWTHEGYVVLCKWLVKHEITPVLLGTRAEKWAVNDIVRAVEGSVDLTEQTSFGDIAELARGAKISIGNDTGPMHIIAATGCTSLVLFSGHSNPHLCAPVGKHIHIMQEKELKDLEVEEVISLIKEILTLDTAKKVTKSPVVKKL